MVDIKFDVHKKTLLTQNRSAFLRHLILTLCYNYVNTPMYSSKGRPKKEFREQKGRIAIPYDAHKHQMIMHLDRHRFRIAVCGRRFGKTTFALNELIFNAIQNKETLNWYVAPTYRQAKQVAWRMLLKYLPIDFIVRKNELELSVGLVNSSRIELKGADNPDSLRGVGLDLVVLDEYASMKPLVWDEIMRPMLLDTGGKAIFIGTPRGYNHFFELFMMGREDSETYDPDYVSWQFSSYENTKIEGVKEKLDKDKETMTEDAFAQEHLADFRHHTGRVYKDFDRKVHVIPPFDTPSTWVYGRYLDRGWRVPSAVGFIGIDENDNWYIIDEIYETNLTNPQLAELIKAKSSRYYIWHSYADSAQASDIADLQDMGLAFTPVKKEQGERHGDWIRSGIERISERLKIQTGTGKPKLFVFSNCKSHIMEFENYEWEEKKGKDLLEVERPKKKNDHAMDGLRYFAMMYRSLPEFDESNLTRDNRNWSFN